MYRNSVLVRVTVASWGDRTGSPGCAYSGMDKRGRTSRIPDLPDSLQKPWRFFHVRVPISRRQETFLARCSLIKFVLALH
jgi:hypothetical protein